MTARILAHARRLLELYRATASIAAVVLMAGLGLFALHRLLDEVNLHDVRFAIHSLQSWQVGAALALTATSYLTLTFYDVLALRIIARPLPWRTAALASFSSYTLSHNLGLSLLTGGSARYRVYSASGLEAGDIARIIATASLTFWAGVMVMASIAIAIHPENLVLGSITVAPALQRAIGLALLAMAGWLVFRTRHPGQSLRILGWSLPLPTVRQALAQIVVAGFDLVFACSALFVLIPGADIQQFPLFFLSYALAIIVAQVTHIPGGIGVFEAVIVATLPAIDKPTLMAALIAYRVIYYLLPLLLAAVLLAIHEHKQWRGPVGTAIRLSQVMVRGIAPEILAVLTFVGGVILLISGSLPALPHRLHALRDLVPLPFVEASHIAASLAGTGLLLLAPGLYRRLDGAFILTRLMLVAGAVFSLAKGFDYEEAAVLIVIAALLQWARTSFSRRTAFTVRSFTAGWLAAVVIVLALSLWIGFFAYKHVDYQSDLWWQFAWKGDASRFMRATFAAAVLVISTILVRFFRPSSPTLAGADLALRDENTASESIDHTDAMLAWTGDKRFLGSPTGAAFLMYQVQGHSWIVMGDPIGAISEWPDLLWRIRERSDAAQGRLLLYQISPQALPIAIDLGLQLIKYGEEARVDLTRFSLEGPDAKSLRYAERRAVREGAEFEVIPAAQTSAIMAELRQISDAWLKAKRHSEKAFSVGRFDPVYLARFDCAVVRCEGKIVAFANIWATANRNEISVDLMRHVEDMPYGTMDFLFVRLMEWGRDQGYAWFSLGIAPLAGIEARRLAPIWAKAGALLYRHGDTFYAFDGLRAYKDKFSPQWEPRYIAGPHGIGLVRALIDLQTLVGGGRNSAARRFKMAVAA